ncbi:MAG: protein kinase [Planctomycetaceae bacterium]|nr:protein kinase [Planctomycetaceae bacterium]
MGAAFEHEGILFRCPCGRSQRVQQTGTVTCAKCGRVSDVGETTGSQSLLDTFFEIPVAELNQEPEAGDDPLIGTWLGHFRIEAALGRGGASVVYRALDESLQRHVALKVIRGHASESTGETRLEVLREEARAQASLQHPHVASVYYVGEQAGVSFLAMELVSGESLYERLRREPLSYPEVIELATQIIAALQAAAAQDVMHGDLKPNNILLTRNGEAKLSDFGLARSVGSVGETGEAAMGTPGYLAPEAWISGQVDLRSDMYSLGVMLFEMTYGRKPYDFGDGRMEQVLHAHCRGDVQFPGEASGLVPEAWKGLLLRLMSKSPEDRFGDYRELAAAVCRLRPIPQTAAGMTSRALAWGIDLLCMGLVALMLGGVGLALVTLLAGHALDPRSVQLAIQQLPLLGLALIGLAPFIPLSASLWQAEFGSTPGKRLMQLRIVDRFGAVPERRVLWRRSFLQFAVVWLLILHGLADALRLLPLYYVSAAVVGLLLIIDAVSVLRPRRRTIHDQLCGTLVVLDAGAESWN